MSPGKGDFVGNADSSDGGWGHGVTRCQSHPLLGTFGISFGEITHDKCNRVNISPWKLPYLFRAKRMISDCVAPIFNFPRLHDGADRFGLKAFSLEDLPMANWSLWWLFSYRIDR